jgi:hypothetical protein
MNDKELLNLVAARLGGNQQAAPGSGSGIARPSKMDDKDPYVARSARRDYVEALTNSNMSLLNADEKKAIREECDAVLKDSGFNTGS